MNSSKQYDVPFKDRIATVKELIDPVYLIENLGFKITNETAKEVRAACCIHGGDNSTAFRVNKDLKTWTCFTHKCHEIHGNDVLGLIRAVKQCSFMEALEYLEELTGSKNLNKHKLFEYRRRREQREFVRNNVVCQEIPSVVDDHKLKYYKPFRSDYFETKGFSSETLDLFEIAGGYTDCDGVIRDIIPIRNDLGKLVAYSLRDIRDDANVDYDRKYKLTSGFDKDVVLYNLYRAKELAEDRPLIIVEGFKSVWRLHDYGIDNVVACMGSGVTLGQCHLLCTYARKGVVLFFDNDFAGAQALGRSYDLLKGKMKIHAEFITETNEDGSGADPADLTKEQVLIYLNKYTKET